MNKGKLIFKTPKNSTFRRVICLIIWITLFVVIYKGIILNKMGQPILPQLFAIFAMWGAFWLISLQILYPSFSIYENGVTLSQVWTIKRLINIESRFIPLSEIHSFQISRDKKTCNIFIKTNKKSTFVRQTNSWGFYNYKENIKSLANFLREIKIQELLYLFSLDIDYKHYLIEGNVSDELKKAFEDNSCLIPISAKITKIYKDKWEIRDGNKIYVILDNGVRVIIYELLYDKDTNTKNILNNSDRVKNKLNNK